MRKNLPILLIVLGGSVLFTSCETDHGVYRPLDTNRNSLENTDRFVLLDKQTQRSITTSGLQERQTDDGRLQVVASVRNRRGSRVEVQINCIFKDAKGLEMEQTPLQNLALPGNGQESVTFTATKLGSKNYTIRVRQVR